MTNMFQISGLFVAALLCIGGGPADALGADRTVLVYDASGSMTNVMPDGRAKYVVAREALSGLVSNWAGRSALGLVVYGHRTAACDDIELRLPAKAPFDDASFRQNLRGIVPNGKTPLMAAITEAADHLDYKNAPANLVVLTDGGETCQLEPCDIARQMKQESKDLRVHIVAFDVKSDEVNLIQCIADAFETELLRASDGQELLETLAIALSHTGLAGQMVMSQLRADQLSSLLRGLNGEMRQAGADHDEILEAFTIMVDMTDGVLDALAEDGAIWRRLNLLSAKFGQAGKAAEDKSFKTGNRQWQVIANMWFERGKRVGQLKDQILSERADAASRLSRLEDDQFMIGQLLALDRANEAIEAAQKAAIRLKSLNDGLVGIANEINSRLEPTAVMQ